MRNMRRRQGTKSGCVADKVKQLSIVGPARIGRKKRQGKRGRQRDRDRERWRHTDASSVDHFIAEGIKLS